MNLLAATLVGTTCALVAGALLGTLPRFRVPRRSRRPWDLPLTPARFWAGSAGGGLVCALLLTAVTGSVFIALVPACVVTLFPRAYFTRRQRVHARAMHEAWPDGLRDLVASITAGQSLTQAVTNLATDGPMVLRRAFARFPELSRMLGTAPALEMVKAELADPTSDRVIEVLLIAHERGGSIVRDILDDLVDATTRDIKLLDALETEGLETRINARAVVVMPWLVLVALTARPGPFRAFYRSSGGVVTLVIAAVMSALGVVVLSRLGREPVEQQVFG